MNLWPSCTKLSLSTIRQGAIHPTESAGVELSTGNPFPFLALAFAVHQDEFRTCFCAFCRMLPSAVKAEGFEPPDPLLPK